MNVSVVIPTRGDQDLSEIISSLSQFDEVLIWDNSKREDLGVYARYAMIEKARNDVILTQDDDCVLASEAFDMLLAAYQPGHVVCNLPERFRPHYPDSALVGFGAIFDRTLPQAAFDRFIARWVVQRRGFDPIDDLRSITERLWDRECDTVFTTLTPRTLVDVPYRDLPWASSPNRLWKQPDHVAHRKRMLELARKVRDA